MDLLEAFILVLGIMDPLMSLTAFLSLTRKLDEKKKRAIALKGVLVAATVFFIFAVGGQNIMSILGISLPSFKAAGGILLILLGLQMALGLKFPKEKEELSEISVVIGTPLITGPATITTAMILAKDTGLVVTSIAGASALFVTLLVLVFGSYITRLLGKSGVQVMSTMMGVVTIAWGLQFLLTGIGSFSS